MFSRTTSLSPHPGLLEDALEVVEGERDLSGHVADVLRSAVGAHGRLPRAEQGPGVTGDDLTLVEAHAH